jgi:prepilin-type N-terminal cleavage/methylation domain-containing protein
VGKIIMMRRYKPADLTSVTQPLKKPGGFTMIEVLVTMVILTSGLMILFTVFNMVMRDASTTRNWMMAEIIADSLLEEILDHEYGTPIPPSWNQSQQVKAIIQGRPSVITFEKKVTTQYGSFAGTGAGDYDQVDVKITWTEGTGPQGSARTKTYSESVWVRRNYL